ncbi:hypothetical protein A3C59_01765 [Candidatus Daviesbacteria bacterium RIFCSPHIGHO2_02_FULL_36_13]|uniref:Uncharacterized protein n=1 Tax=Candidatus Daviesbacteria bacterium RIFCSPHIGHO2_02_FULL_36_13 TaxID=1797768 RepID=A0A1F5JWT6_9BACT|nr:MAG: hypothetical protein A3C59_01765 [Candidatus Daviesbacteria bacterium RIFCSPHIGHO2_02_FULL_36_13]OGE41027.1 MAG: hypothetical protein A3A45_03935 [Candidatus Daviesbacteria bacterium RIFCSPLOWO2_01_FULL_36_8]
MPKKFLFTITLIVIVVTAYLTLLVNFRLSTVSKNDIDTAVNQAKHLYNLKKSRGESFENGLCLSDALLPNWVVDIVHHPRLAIDELPENQCPSLVEGRAKHFVELDIEGKLIRAQ